MKPHTAPIALLALAGPAVAQSYTSGSQITFALHWQDTGNHNGILEPGESASLALDASFTNQNTVATFSPPIATFGSGTIRGLGGGLVDLRGSATSGTAAGAWNVEQAQGYGVSGDWDVTGGLGNGTPEAMGAILRSIQFGQFCAACSAINTTNPILEVWRGIWTPASYAPRTVTFSTGPDPGAWPGAGALLFRLYANFSAYTVYVVLQNINFGAVQITIVPAPPSLALVTIAPFVRRRRRAEVVR